MQKRYWGLLGVEGVAVLALLGSGFTGPSAPAAASVSDEALLSAVASPRLRRLANLGELNALANRLRPQMFDVGEGEAAAAADAAAPASDAAAEPADAAVPPPEMLAPANSITNNQTSGVDEGGIVKSHGSHLVVLRRGRLFTIDTAGGTMRLIDKADAFPPTGKGDGAPDAWYDEMLVSGDMVIVIGFNYARAGTEINRFTISSSGQLSWRDTHVLRSDDYYSSENYTSRLIGNDLIVYTPLFLSRSPLDSLPALASYDAPSASLGDFESIVDPSSVYITEQDFTNQRVAPSIAHSVSRCDLSAERLDCDSTVVLGDWSRSFYVSQDAVYVWTGEADYPYEGTLARLYRIPLGAGEPGVVRTMGYPVNQFSFREDKGNGRLNVLVQFEGRGDGMWSGRGAGGAIKLLQLPLGRFDSGDGKAEAGLYRLLPSVSGYGMANRFVGNHLLYGGGEEVDINQNGIGRRTGPKLNIVPLDGGDVTTISPGHQVDRIDIMGRDAIVVGQDSSNQLIFSAIGLDRTPAVVSRYAFPAASEGESRSHAFFYRPDAEDRTGDSGLLGLPIRGRNGYRGDALISASAAILYLRRNQRSLSPVGQLRSEASGNLNDHCLASCTDWYGNARPIFLGSRIFALMGYELVEGRLSNGQISEIGRISFRP